MTLIGHLLLFFFAGFAVFMLYSDRRSPIGALLFLAFLAGGIYLLGWIALVTFVLGGAVGGKVFVVSRQKARG